VNVFLETTAHGKRKRSQAVQYDPETDGANDMKLKAAATPTPTKRKKVSTPSSKTKKSTPAKKASPHPTPVGKKKQKVKNESGEQDDEDQEVTTKEAKKAKIQKQESVTNAELLLSGPIDDEAAAKLITADMSAVLCKPDDVDVVLFHGGCPDGFTAAFIAWLKLGDKATYIGIGHGDAEAKKEAAGDLAGKHVAVLDFSFDAETTKEQLETAASYVVLDHHKTAKENLAALPDANKVFEMKMSGATLSWNFFFPGEECPLLFRYIEDKDIWRWALHNSKEFDAAFCLTAEVPSSGEITTEAFTKMDKLYRGGDSELQKMLAQGKILVAYMDREVKSACKKAKLRRLKAFPDFVCSVVNSTTLPSEIGHALTSQEGTHFAMIFTNKLDCYTASLRSNFPSEGQADVSVIASHFKGGGHAAAAGVRFAGLGDLNDLFLPEEIAAPPAEIAAPPAEIAAPPAEIAAPPAEIAAPPAEIAAPPAEIAAPPAEIAAPLAEVHAAPAEVPVAAPGAPAAAPEVHAAEAEAPTVVTSVLAAPAFTEVQHAAAVLSHLLPPLPN